jgi:hypothetical protein
MSTPTTEADDRLRAWAGSVRRLVAVAPIRAVIDETGLPVSGHSTQPERQAIRRAALETVDRWLARDLASLRKPGQPPVEQREYCGDCDGVGWVEGGPTLQTTCARCKGTGFEPG